MEKRCFPPGILSTASPEPWQGSSQVPRVNMATQTDPPEEPATSLPGIPEVMAAIATSQAALTTKIDAV